MRTVIDNIKSKAKFYLSLKIDNLKIEEKKSDDKKDFDELAWIEKLYNMELKRDEIYEMNL